MTDYEWLTEMGLCHKCRKNKVAPGKKFCFDCLDKIRELNAEKYDSEKAREYQPRRREIYKQKKENGICIRCNKKATHGMYCYEHYLKEHRKSMERAAAAKREREERGLVQEKRKEAGLCLWCGEPAVPGMQCCEAHRKIFSKAGKKGFLANVENKNNPYINELVAYKKKAGYPPYKGEEDGRIILKTDKIEEFRIYLMDLERSPNTIDSYIRSVSIFFDRYNELNKENMLDFKKWQLEKWKPKSAHNRVVAMNQFCIFMKHQEYCVKGIKIHGSSSVENVITLEEYHLLLDGLKEDKNEKGYWMVKFLAKTGARVSEFIKLTKDSLENGYCEMWTKGKIRRIYIPQALIEESREYFSHQDSDYLFPNRCGKQMTARGVAQNIKNWAKKYGIRDEVAHPHSFRHLYAIEFLQNNSNIALLADLMGHSSVNTTSIYLKLSKEEQMKQFNEASNW